MVIISAAQQQIYTMASVVSVGSVLVYAMFPQSVKIAMAIKKRRSFVILSKNDGEIELVEANYTGGLWEVDGDKKGESRGTFESKPADVRKLFGRPAMFAHETVTPGMRPEACVLVRHLKTKLGVNTWREYEALKDEYMATRAQFITEMDAGELDSYRDTDLYKSMTEAERITFSYFDALWTDGYFPDVIEPIRLQDMERFLKYYHDPRSYVVKERNAVSTAIARNIVPKEINYTKWLIIGAMVIVALIMFSGSGDSSSAESAYAVSNPLSSYLGV